MRKRTSMMLGGGAALANKISSTVGGHDYPEAESYAVSDDAEAEVDAALALAADRGTRVLLVMGANWCHDSRAFAGWMETPRFQQLISDHYELVYVNIGMPQSGDGHNLQIAERFGLDDLPGTPNLLVLTPEGEEQGFEGVAPGRRVVVFGNNDDAHRTARGLAAAGVHVAALVDRRAGAVKPEGGPGQAGGGV